jgi:hypothetical protein
LACSTKPKREVEDKEKHEQNKKEKEKIGRKTENFNCMTN